MTSDLSSALEVCIDDDALYKLTYISFYFTLHTHNRFTDLMDFVGDYPGEPVPER